MKESEKTIQKILYKYFFERGGLVFCDNVFLSAWEADFVAISSSGSLYECEIKKSKADYLRDFKKTRKHSSLKKAYNLARQGLSPSLKGIPSYFYYVCEKSIISSTEIPDYAGLIYVDLETGKASVVRKAKKLIFKSQLTQEILQKIASSLSHRKFQAL